MAPALLGNRGPQYYSSSFHWQRSDGTPICRWDNAPHHRDVATFLHHLHEGCAGVAQAHAPFDVFAVLGEIEKRLSVA